MTTQPPRGLPGLSGVEHVGFTVPDLDAATAFFTEVIGCDLIYQLGPFGSEDDWMADHLNVQPRAVATRINFLRCGKGPNFEIFEYKAPDQNLTPPRNSDVGGHHLAFYVEDLDAAIAHLRRHRVRILGEPTESTGPSKGQRWVYFLTPWGMQLELVSFPDGKAYEDGAEILLWHPAR